MFTRLRNPQSLTLLLVALAMLSGCSTAESQSLGELSANPWTVTRFDEGNGRMTPPVLPQSERAVELSLDFGRGGTLSGFTGLNNFGGPYEADSDGSMKIGPLAATKMAGTPELMNQEEALFAALDRVAAFRLESDGLTLVDEAGKQVVRARPQESSALEETTWRCTAYNNGADAIVPVASETEITATFRDGSVVGSSGVNTYSGSYELDGQRLSINMPATTSANEGSAEAMEQERLYLAAIADVKTYRIERDELTLLGAGGIRLAEYLAQP